MDKLDNLKAIKKLDQSNMLSSVEVLGKQVEQIWEEMEYFRIPDDYKEVENVLVDGMGGSGMGALIIQSLYFDKLQVPFQVMHDYHLPQHIGNHSLVILSSYSGTTEEVLQAGEESLTRGAKIVGIGTGSKLEKFCTERHLPFLKINPLHNPCNQPRMGLGYSIFGQFGILDKVELIKVGGGEVGKIVYLLEEGNKRLGVDIERADNPAKKMAHMLYGKLVVYTASEFLSGTAYAVRNQMNENAKQFGFIYDIPELNHHLMEGLKNPKTNPENIKWVFLNSEFYDERNRMRIEITKEILKQNGIAYTEFKPQSEAKIFQVFETLGFFSYVNFYLAMLNDLDPSPIPYVDFFKKELVRRRKT